MIAWLTETWVATTLLMIVVLALRVPVARGFGARWAYALWLIPALRVILPPLPALLPQETLPPVVIVIPATVRLAALPSAEIASNWEWMPFLAALWAGGAVIFMVLQWLDYRNFLKSLGSARRVAAGDAVPAGIAMLVSAEVDGPVALGLLHRKIVLPTDFERRYSPAEQRLAIAHELIHHRRGDLWWNLVALVILAFNWFNPFAWFAFRAFRSDQELACDAAVAARASSEERHDYASALVKAASRPGLIAACPLTRVGQLKHRLRMMRRHRISRIRSLGGGASIAALAIGAFLLGTPGFSHQPERRIVYRSAPPAAPVQLAATMPVRELSAAVRPHPAAAALPPRTRRLARPAVLAGLADLPVIVAASTPLPLAETRPKLAPLPRIAAVAPHPPAPPVSYRVHSALVFAVSPSDPVRRKLEAAARVVLRIQNSDEAELREARAAFEHLQGSVRVSVAQSVDWEE